MSESVSVRSEVSSGIRRREYLERVRDTTSRYLVRYQSLLADLVNQDLEEFMPAEFDSVRSRLLRIESLLSSDPERARQLSMEVGAEISSLPAIARTAKREFEVHERLRQQELSQLRQQARTELTQFLHEQIALFTDPVERDFAFDHLKAMHKDFSGRIVQPGELANIQAEIRSRVETIRSNASKQATEWKASKAREVKKEAQQTLISLCSQEIENDIEKHPKALTSVLDSLQTLRERLSEEQEAPESEIQHILDHAMKAADQAIVDENCRRATVRAVLAALKQSGFVTAQPQRLVGDSDEVVISARKPAGAEAMFRITVDGELSYKFEHYEGMTCKADIDKILPILQDVYGISLSHKRVLWQNPDRLSKSAKPIDEGSQENRSGN